MRILLLVFLLILIILFFVGVFVPRRSRRVQGWIDVRLERHQELGDRSNGRIGTWIAKGLDLMQRATDAALRGGRRLRGRAEN